MLTASRPRLGRLITALIALFALAALIATFGALDARFASAADLSVARTGATATTLGDGRVLIAGGGSNLTTPVQTVEVYHPATDTITVLTNLNVPRMGHTATLLDNGRVLIAGGATDTNLTPTNLIEIYDPSGSGSTSVLGTTMTETRSDHAAAKLVNGDVLITGGNRGETAATLSADIYDASTSMVAGADGMFVARMFHTATLMKNGKILVVGGASGTITGSPASILSAGADIMAVSANDTAELYNPSTEKFETLTAMPDGVGRYAHTATALADDNILVAGGRHGDSTTKTAIFYDPDTDFWSKSGDLTVGRSSHSATRMADNRVIVIGGLSPGVILPSYLKTTEIWDPADGTWAASALMANGRAGHRSNLLASARVLVTGGFDGVSALAPAELFVVGSGCTPDRFFQPAPAPSGANRVYSPLTFLICNAGNGY